MPYTKNPHLPKVRADAVNMLRFEGRTVRAVARYYGVSPGTVSKWNKKVPTGSRAYRIATQSSRPKHHPQQVDTIVVERVIALRKKLRGRCGEVIHAHLREEGYTVSQRTVQRVLDRAGLLKKKSPWKRLHKSTERPEALKPGDLVQVDTIHLLPQRDIKKRIFVYTLVDVYSRWAYAWASQKSNSEQSVVFVRRARKRAPFPFTTLQSDNGSEFSTHFTERINITHRHTRVRQPNDNAHLERFNRTVQQELITGVLLEPKNINRLLPKYLRYYNTERKHLGINLQTPQQIIEQCFQGRD